MHEFAHGGLHGTSVERIARRVDVAQPYVFTLFDGKRGLFLAAVERGFEHVSDLFTRAAEEFDPAAAPPGATLLGALGEAYIKMLNADRDYLMLQHQAYSACDDGEIRERVRACYARLVSLVQRLSGAGQEQIDDFFRHGMWLNVAAAMGVEDLSAGCTWIRAQLRGADAD